MYIIPYNQLTTKPIGKVVINAYLNDLKVINNTIKEAIAANGMDLNKAFVPLESSTSLTKGDPVIPKSEN